MSSRNRSAAALTVAALASMACVACGAGSAGPGSAGPGSANGSSGAGVTRSADESSAPPPIEVTDDLPVTTPPARGVVVTLTGRVSDGVEAGCLILSTPTGAYTLIGPLTAGLRPGPAVTVTGRVDDDRATTCQQGRPLLVSTVRSG